jgi:hypothetical protein
MCVGKMHINVTQTNVQHKQQENKNRRQTKLSEKKGKRNKSK